MVNQEIAKLFYEIAHYLEMKGVAFKPYAYEKAADALAGLNENAAEIYKKGGVKALKNIPGVGENIARKIEEYVRTGKIRCLLEFKKKMPLDLEALIAVEGVGPKRIGVLYRTLGIKNLKDLEKAARAGRIAGLFGFGAKSEKNILQGIEFLKRTKDRFLLGEILPIAREAVAELKKAKAVEQVGFAGSVRRMKETIGDVDILAIAKNSKKIMDFFCSRPDVVKIWSKGATKSSVRLKHGFDADIRVVPAKSYGAALQYFTGSKEHNIVVRKIAMEKGLKLSEYGLFRGAKMIAGKSEEEIYNALGMDYIEPELRENQGEIEAALKHKLPRLIVRGDIKGDLHCHSDWDGGENSIEEMAEAAREMNYEYIGIADHTKFLRIENGLDERRLAEQRKEIDKINKKFQVPSSKFQVLQGCEANILADGSIDIKDEALAKLDFVIAGIHSGFKMSKEKMTERLIRAMKNPHIDIISHPTGRLLQRRDEYQIDYDKILRAARETGTILEINSQPSRLDLNDRNIRRAKSAGVKMAINTDSHHKNQMGFIEFGVSQARRGWAEKKDIINAQPLEKLTDELDERLV